MTWNIRSFSVNRSIEFETLHGSLIVYCCDFQGARSNLDVFDNLWCARSVQQEFSHAWTVPCISAPCSCCTESQCLLSGHFCCCMHFVWYYSVSRKFMLSKLWILNWDLILNFLHAFCMVLVLKGRLSDGMVTRSILLQIDNSQLGAESWFRSKIHILFLRAYAWNNEIFSVYWECLIGCAGSPMPKAPKVRSVRRWG